MELRICLVTGATSGIGRATAQALAGSTVTIVARDPARGDATVEDIRRQTGTTEWMSSLADLSSQASSARSPPIAIVEDDLYTIDRSVDHQLQRWTVDTADGRQPVAHTCWERNRPIDLVHRRVEEPTQLSRTALPPNSPGAELTSPRLG